MGVLDDTINPGTDVPIAVEELAVVKVEVSVAPEQDEQLVATKAEKRPLEQGKALVPDSKVAKLDWAHALEELGGNEMCKPKTPPPTIAPSDGNAHTKRPPGIHTFIAMLRQPIGRGPAQVRQRYLVHAMKNIIPLMTILEAAPDPHLRWLASQALATYGTFLMQKHWTSRDFGWGNRWDTIVPYAMTMLECKQPFMKRAVGWLGAVWAGDLKKSATAILGQAFKQNLVLDGSCI